MGRRRKSIVRISYSFNHLKRSSYINGINGSYQNIPPPIWNGGILADEMGLGKTLQMISLIAADKEFRRQPHEARPVSSAGPRMATLVVVPLSCKL